MVAFVHSKPTAAHTKSSALPLCSYSSDAPRNVSITCEYCSTLARRSCLPTRSICTLAPTGERTTVLAEFEAQHSKCVHSSDCNSPVERWVGQCVEGQCFCASETFTDLRMRGFSQTQGREKRTRRFAKGKTRFCILPSDTESSSRNRLTTPRSVRCIADSNCGTVGGGYCWLKSKEFTTTGRAHAKIQGELVGHGPGESTRWGRCVCEEGYGPSNVAMAMDDSAQSVSSVLRGEAMSASGKRADIYAQNPAVFRTPPCLPATLPQSSCLDVEVAKIQERIALKTPAPIVCRSLLQVCVCLVPPRNVL